LCQITYSLRFILIDSSMDVSRTKMCLDTFTLESINRSTIFALHYIDKKEPQLSIAETKNCLIFIDWRNQTWKYISRTASDLSNQNISRGKKTNLQQITYGLMRQYLNLNPWRPNLQHITYRCCKRSSHAKNISGVLVLEFSQKKLLLFLFFSLF
jgi:hypothetical protein